ncbi:MAG: tetratricopeptide repeat protein [Humidesulfovibrio sp.]|nr:tetratricopeptide repeat protein [Humidesulfovibrio sp.]
MDENTPQGQDHTPFNPAVAEQLEQIKKVVPNTSERLFEFLTDNLKAIIVGCIAIILGVAAYEGVSRYRAHSAAKAADVLGVILIQKTEPNARVEALEGFLKDAPSSLKPTAELELAAAAMVAKQYDKATAAWTDLEGSSSTDMKTVAGIGHARSLMLQGKAQDALTLLQALKAKAPEAYKSAVTRQIAVAAEAAGNNKVASDAYTELAGKGNASAGKAYFEFKANQLKSNS